jgi:N-acetylglutamate synthase-like GNAT family acetyltransferase
MTTALVCPDRLLEQSYSRIAEESDLHSIVSLVNRAFADENPVLLADRVDHDEIRELMRKGHFLLLEKEGEIIALIYAEIREDRRGYLGLLVVDPVRRRSGLGKQMLCAGEQFCRQQGCSLIEGVVLNRRPDLLERYLRFGFRIAGEIPGDRQDHVDGGYNLILIEKDLLDQGLQSFP